MELPSKHDFDIFESSHTQDMSRLCAQIDTPGNAASLANNAPGTKQNNDAWKAEVERINKEMSDYNDKLGHIQHTIEREHTEISNNVRRMKKETKELVGRIRDNQDIVELRKEQAEELKTKYGANVHSSYLGLWRPLEPETHAVLYTTSIVLALVSVVGLIWFFFRNGFPVLFAATAPSRAADAFNESETTAGLLGGGARKLMKLLRRK